MVLNNSCFEKGDALIVFAVLAFRAKLAVENSLSIDLFNLNKLFLLLFDLTDLV